MVKNQPAKAGDIGLILGCGIVPREGNDNPFLYSWLGNPVDREAWWIIVYGVTKELDITSQLNNKPIKFSFDIRNKNTKFIHHGHYVNLLGKGKWSNKLAIEILGAKVLPNKEHKISKDTIFWCCLAFLVLCRGGSREELPQVQGAAAVRAQEGWEELLPVQGQEGWPWGDNPRPR